MTAHASRVFRVALLVLAIHVLDASFAQPVAGTSPVDRLLRGLVLLLAGLSAAAWSAPRLRGADRGAMNLVFGVLAVVAGSEAVYHRALRTSP